MRMFQFTRPRGARHEYWPEFAHLGVSIHAPARGATGRVSGRSRFVLFQFTRPRGARQIRLLPVFWQCSFNSRAREGRDTGKGLTERVDCRFNSRAREGRDLGVLCIGNGDYSFNSRAREGRDNQ